MTTSDKQSAIGFVLLAVLFLLAGGLTSCSFFSGSDDLAGQAGVYAGVYIQGIEDSFFEPCIADEVWSLVEIAGTTFIPQVTALVERGENPMYVQLRGVPSERGEYRGFFATYDREFSVETVEEVRVLREGDCLRR